MADEETAAPDADAGGGEAAPKKKSKKMLFIIIGAVVLLLAGGGGAGFFLFGDTLLGGGDPEAQAEAEAAKQLEAEEAKVAFYDLPEMLVNLSHGGPQNNYLKISVSLEIRDETLKPELEAQLPRIVDQFQVYLRELRIEDINGSAGAMRLKEELHHRVALITGVDGVRAVLFREMLVQ